MKYIYLRGRGGGGGEVEGSDQLPITVFNISFTINAQEVRLRIMGGC